MVLISPVNRIAKELSHFHVQKILIDLQAFLWIALALGSLITLSLLSLESIFWFSATVRFNIWLLSLWTSILLLFLIVILIFLITQNKIKRYTHNTIAIDIGKSALEKHDELLNALQLEETVTTENRTSTSLANKFIESIHQRLADMDPKSVLSNKRVAQFRNLSLILVGALLILSGLFFSQLKEAGIHWIHPRVNFPIPHPYELIGISKNLSLMGGDNAAIQFTASDDTPENITLEIIGRENYSAKILPKDENGLFTYEIKDVFQNLHYRAFVKSSHFWQPWNEISSPTYTISVTDRPKIEDFTVTITPPRYTQLSPVVQKGNIAEIRGLKGSTIALQLKADKNLKKAYLNYGPVGEEKKFEMSVNRKRANAEFTLMEDGILETNIFDSRKIGNLNPIQYRLMVIDDLHPNLQIIQPNSPMELGSDFTIPVQLHIEDDFGFSNLQIVYETQHPDYITGYSGETRELVSVQSIHEYSKTKTSQDVYYAWDVNDLNLMPDDELKFHFELYDNDIISGPKKAISPTLIARFPSLADLFARTEEEEIKLEETANEIMEDLSDLDEKLESMELELLKSEELTWEQEQIVKKSIDEVQEKINQIQQMQEKIEQIIEQSEKHGLFSQEMRDKFQNLQELLEDILTPELLESMDMLQQAMEEASQEQLMEALENFRNNTAEMEAQLDRFLEIFERIRAEQKLEEAVTRLEELLKKQEDIVNKLNNDPDASELKQLTEDQTRNSQEFENIQEIMKDAAESMEQYAQMPSEELKSLAQSELSEQTNEFLSDASKQLGRQDTQAGSESAKMGQKNLEKMLQQLQSIQQQFQQQTVEEMANKFENIFQNTLYISKGQEKLRKETSDLPRTSPRLGEKASQQQMLRDQLNQLIQSIMELSRQTFSVTPEMGKAIGKASAGMNESLVRLEERNGTASAQEQAKTVGALNEAAIATLSAINAMQQSGSASGFEEFLKRMEQMAGQQQGINSQSLQLALGQMAASAQEGLMKRLSQEQSSLKKSLQQMMQEMRGSKQSGGNLNGIAEDMEEVIKDFNRRKFDRRTIERQQRILSRMLDSQKSLKQRDLSKKRKSRVAEDIFREGPAGLPADLGQRRNLVMEALNLALKSGYSKDYQDMIRRYFNALLEASEEEEYVLP